MDKEKDEVSTRLRLPAELHHKLGALAKLDNNRSLHNYMLKILQDHVYGAEKQILDEYEDIFDQLYKTVFGTKYAPYSFEVDNINVLINPPFGSPRATGRRVGQIENTNKPSDE